jgi:hypothetical protein
MPAAELRRNMVHEEDFELTRFAVRQLVPMARAQRKKILTLTARAGLRWCAVRHIRGEQS